jgi:hypothetical protein
MNLIQNDVKKVKYLLWTLTQFIRYSLQMGIGFFYIWSLLGTPDSSALSLANIIQEHRDSGELEPACSYTLPRICSQNGNTVFSRHSWQLETRECPFYKRRYKLCR